MSFDTFGKRRDPATWAAISTPPGAASITDKGYTDQQELDGLGLIHMEGRVYDPVLGRFVSGDPFIPDLYNSQSLDRYAYVNNNPMNHTDPTGFDPADSSDDNTGDDSGSQFSIGTNPDFNFDSIQLYLTSGLSFQQTSPTLSAGGTDLNDGLFSITQTNETGNTDPTNFANSSQTSGIWGSFSQMFAPYTTRFGQQGEAGSVVDGLEGASKVVWNTIADLGELTISYNNYAALGGIEQIPHFQVNDKQLMGASIAEMVLAVGVVGDLSKADVLERLSLARQLGGEGESAVRSLYDIGDKVQIGIDGRMRVPDGLIPGMSISEVKNVGYLSYTQQLRDFTQYANDGDLRFDLYVRPSTIMSSPLLDAIESGQINRMFIP
jgi:RHS repeat-associated protein